MSYYQRANHQKFRRCIRDPRTIIRRRYGWVFALDAATRPALARALPVGSPVTLLRELPPPRRPLLHNGRKGRG